MAEDALDCITSLLDSLPSWIDELNDITNSYSERQKELLSTEQPSPIRTLTPKRSFWRLPTLHTLVSIRTKKSLENLSPNASAIPPVPTLPAANACLRTETYPTEVTYQKIRSASICSGAQPSIAATRPRARLSVYYDGTVQKSLATVVNGIGRNRNLIRKGKLGAKVSSFARSGSSGSEASCNMDSDDSTPNCDDSKFSSRRTGSNAFQSKGDGTETFVTIDKLLEQAQTLIEKAGHQFLRGGDPSNELRLAKEHFDNARLLADIELPTVTRRVEKAAARAKRDAERRPRKPSGLIIAALAALDTSDDYDHDDDPICDWTLTQNPLKCPSMPMLLPGESPLEIDLEVDDSTDGDTMPEFQMPVRRRVGKSPLPSHLDSSMNMPINAATNIKAASIPALPATRRLPRVINTTTLVS